MSRTPLSGRKGAPASSQSPRNVEGEERYMARGWKGMTRGESEKTFKLKHKASFPASGLLPPSQLPKTSHVQLTLRI